MKGAMAMYDHKWKKWAVIVSVVAMVAMVSEKFLGFILFKKLTASQHYVLFEWLMLAAMATVIYCKEEFDDDRAKMIRLKSLQIAFLSVVAVLLSVGLTGSTIGKFELDPQIFLTFAAFGIVIYLLVFHIGLYFDFLWDYNDTGVIDNFKNIGKNVWSILAYLLISAVTLAVVTFL